VAILYAATLLWPIMPSSSQKIFESIGIKINKIDDIKNVLNQNITFKKPENLFNRI
jgi:methionyl-tRNA synthetase